MVTSSSSMKRIRIAVFDLKSNPISLSLFHDFSLSTRVTQPLSPTLHPLPPGLRLSLDHGLSLRSTTASVHSLRSTTGSVSFSQIDSLSHGLRLSLDHGLSLRPPRPQSSPSTLSQSRPSLFRLMSKSKQRISLGLRKIKTLFSEVLIEQGCTNYAGLQADSKCEPQ
ncbi:uncharacterized protein LOC112198934 [Rosa chinensis]|uniref:uncharacterized protein LOC112198934 n=1 Tax=Rosa chinensis TaxID=74649 RepID=UPI001AD8F0C4|nr:uncharacterized protein LOC112198934 [Rosa chinensis]